MKPIKMLTTLLKLVGTGAVCLTLAACYGAQVAMKPLPPGHRYFFLVVSKKGHPEQVIKGIKVTLVVNRELSQVMGTTDALGQMTFEYKADAGQTILVEDVDGADNRGDFQSRTFHLDKADSTIELEEKVPQ